MSKSGNEGQTRKRTRLRPVGRRIGLLLIVPLLSLLGLWVFAAAISLGAATARIEFTRTVDDVARPIGLVGNALQVERTAAATMLGTGGAQGGGELEKGQKGTDAALAAFRQKSLPAAADVADGRTLQSLRELDREYGRIGSLRAQIAAGTVRPLDAVAQYNALFDSTNKALSNLATADDVGVYQTTRVLVDVNWARDFVLREDALLTLAQAHGGRLSPAEHAAFSAAAANRRHLADTAFNGPSAAVRDAFKSLARSPQYARYQQLEQSIVGTSTRRVSPAGLAGWRSTIPPVSESWWQGTLVATAALTAQTESVGRDVLYQLVLVGGLGLLVVVASIALSLRFARDISRELRDLQRAAQSLAGERLPKVVARLRRGEKVDVADEAPALKVGRTKEIALVADAFSTVQRTAIETAVGEAQMRAGVSRVFINLAWRSQSLLHRQLRMLDSMERRTSDPDELEDLFRLDHLTTRMRRHAEGLVILSGNENVRGWNEPVAVEPLLRAALAEVEDYARVDVMALSSTLVVGPVVADVVHLLAELIENAASFSPPTTEVLVRAEEVGTGLAIEVIDRGIGLDADDLAEINGHLADPPEFDLADSDRLGFFVVARLADRHGIKVVLQRSAYGGVTAVVLLPPELLVPASRPMAGQVESAGATGALPGAAMTAAPARAPAVPALSSPRTTRMPADGRHRVADLGTDAPAAPVPVPYGAAADRARDPDEEYDVETGGLPRRARQQHLAPQLRSAPGSRQRERAAATGASAGREPADRPAQQNRDLLSSLQAGWTAGREDDEHRPPVFDDLMDQGER